MVHSKTQLDNANALLREINLPATTWAQLNALAATGGSIQARINALTDTQLPDGLKIANLTTAKTNRINAL